MAVVKLGNKYRILYEAKNLQTGLSNISATLRRPDGVKIGPVNLTEEGFSELLGNYAYDLTISANAPVGEWTGTILSSDEGIKSSFRFSVSDDSGSSSSAGDTEEQVDLLVDGSIVMLKIEDPEIIFLKVETEAIDLKVEESEVNLSVQSEEIKLEIDSVSVQFDVDCEEL